MNPFRFFRLVGSTAYCVYKFVVSPCLQQRFVIEIDLMLYYMLSTRNELIVRTYYLFNTVRNTSKSSLVCLRSILNGIISDKNNNIQIKTRYFLSYCWCS